MDELFFNHYRDNRGSGDLAPSFNNQRKLFEIFEKNNNNYFTRRGVNTLTMRLLWAQDNFRKLQDYELKYKARQGNYSIQSTETTTSGVITNILHPHGFIGETIETKTIRVHEYFYSFLTSIVSCLDRLANEINYIYKLNISRVDWRNIETGFHVLDNKNHDLKNYLEKYKKNKNETIQLLLDYRDIVEHEGSVKIKEFSGEDYFIITKSYTIKVQSDPRDENSTINAELVSLCRKFFYLVTNICDDVYGLIINNNISS